MTFRSFSRWVCVLLLAYMAFNLFTWMLVTEKLLTGNRGVVGDLARMGYIPESMLFRRDENFLPRKHVEQQDFSGEPVDIVTIGDSFSNGGGGGKDRFYQDHLASRHNVSVLNIPQYTDIDKVTTLSILNNNGFLDWLKPKFVVLECAENWCLRDLPDTIDFERSISDSDLKKHKTVIYNFTPQQKRSGLLKAVFFSEANIKFIRNHLLYNFSDNAFGSPVFRTKLNRPFFSVPDADVLLFLQPDKNEAKKYTAANITRFNKYLNTLSERLRAKGISLYFMPCVDKYNLYSIYIPDNPYPRSIFFEVLRELPRSYEFIDTKKILREALANGEKDVFYSDDTHWSWKASKRIFERVEFR